MESSYPSKLRLWQSPARSVLGESTEQSRAAAPPTPDQSSTLNPAELAEHLYAREVLNPTAARHPVDEPEPCSLQWFLHVENQRHSRRGRWIPRLLEFTKHAGETLLGLGHGLGTDWVQYARHGASVVVCSPSNAQLTLVRRNFELRGLAGRFLHATPGVLPLEPSSIDVVCVTGLLERVADVRAVLDEVYRVLKPGGKVLAVTPAKYDVGYWHRTLFFWQRWWGGSEPPPGPTERFSRRQLGRLFGRFVEQRIHKRQLRRAEVPHLWRWVPLPILERLLGRVLVLKAFKPLSAAMPAQAAA